jgi:transcriptional regulator with XRE-family HTH domain
MPPRKLRAAAERAFNVRVGARIEKMRKARRMNAKELEELTGLCKGQLYTFESGRTTCSPYKLTKIALALNVDISHLIFDTTIR